MSRRNLLRASTAELPRLIDTILDAREPVARPHQVGTFRLKLRFPWRPAEASSQAELAAPRIAYPVKA